MKDVSNNLSFINFNNYDVTIYEYSFKEKKLNSIIFRIFKFF